MILEFDDLGTHKIRMTMSAVKSGNTYSDSATYTFHVGPVAELEVRDAGASPEVETGQQAYTVTAINNGPDAAPAVRVTGLPTGVTEFVASEGSYNSTTGVWTVGELETEEVRLVSGHSQGPTLTLITEDANAPDITAAIANTRDYAVCIDSSGYDIAAANEAACTGTSGASWHSTNYYDHRPGNNTATIAARAGTGQGHPDAPRSLRVDKFGSLALLRWQPPESGVVNGFGITHYQVERNGVVADDVRGIMYADLRGDAVNQSYRVRAVNNREVPGPWSLPSTWVFDTPAAPNGLGLTATPGAGAGRIDLSWFAPSGETGLSYHIEYAFDGAGPWTRFHTQSETTYSHTGLLLGVTYHYRVAAFRGNLMISPWAYAQATTEGVAVDVPGWPMNLRFTSIDRTAVTLAWDPPADDGGSRVTGYEYRVFGPCPSGADGVCDIVAPRRVSGTSAHGSAG